MQFKAKVDPNCGFCDTKAELEKRGVTIIGEDFGAGTIVFEASEPVQVDGIERVEQLSEPAVV